MVSPIEAINAIGKFSKKNLAFINRLKENDIEFENIKKTMKNTVVLQGCKVVFDYDELAVKTVGKCDKYEEFLDEKKAPLEDES